jgi:hypothetical protein
VTILVDLDNCLADDEWRIPYILWAKTNPFERYHQYHMLGAFDKAKNKEILKGQDVIVMTARPVHYAAATVEWLRRHHIEYRHLMMRNDRDHRPSHIVKQTMLQALLQNKEYEVELMAIKMAYDDHLGIVEMYRSNGLKATQLKIHNVSAYAPPNSKENPQ